MKKIETIQKRIAFLLLIIFTISIAPRVYFHDALAHHKDASPCHHVANSYCLHQQGFNCHFDDLVVSSPFLQYGELTYLIDNSFFPQEVALFSPLTVQQYLQHPENRGPPLG
ncbi:MAG: hypothetical protein ABIN57_02125 [Chitinophagaceae bacterium]